MIVETIFSTLDETGRPNFAPMGVVWGGEFVTVRPYRNTHTCRNLLSSGYGVANLTDDALAYVRCGLYDEILPHFQAKTIPGIVFRETCSWREMELVSRGGSRERAELRCRVLHKGRQKDFLGFCRAGNAVIEAAILATRLDLYDRRMVLERLACYMNIVERTGDQSEKRALQLVQRYIKGKGA
jgi:hypothetical protein